MFSLDKKGFTLIEVMIAISIVGLLAIIIFGVTRSQLSKARDAKRKADIVKIQVASEEYEKDHDCYPPPPPDPTTNCNPGTGLKPYLAKIPCDPLTGSTYYYDTDNPTCPKWYRVYAELENLGDKSIVGPIGPEGADNFYLGSPNAPIPTPAPSSSPFPSGGDQTPTSIPPTQRFWGCKSGVCVEISFDPILGAECSPNFSVQGCSGQCGSPEFPANECIPLR